MLNCMLSYPVQHQGIKIMDCKDDNDWCQSIHYCSCQVLTVLPSLLRKVASYSSVLPVISNNQPVSEASPSLPPDPLTLPRRIHRYWNPSMSTFHIRVRASHVHAHSTKPHQCQSNLVYRHPLLQEEGVAPLQEGDRPPTRSRSHAP